MNLAECLRDRYNYNPETGIFTHARTRLGVTGGRVSGCDNGRGYLRVTLDGKVYYAHRLAWLYVHGEMPKCQIDHINGNPRDNRIANLRLATSKENAWNKSAAQSNSKTKVRGVSWHSKAQKWQAFFGKKYLGLFESIESAKEAHIAAWNAANPFGATS